MQNINLQIFINKQSRGRKRKYQPEFPPENLMTYINTQTNPMPKMIAGRKTPIIIGQADSETFIGATYFIRYDVNCVSVGSSFYEAIEVFLETYCLFRFNVKKDFVNFYNFLSEIVGLKPHTKLTKTVIEKLSAITVQRPPVTEDDDLQQVVQENAEENDTEKNEELSLEEILEDNVNHNM